MASSRKFLKSKILELDKIKARHGRETYETDGADHRPGCGTDSNHPRPPITPGYPGGCPPFKILKNLELIFLKLSPGQPGGQIKNQVNRPWNQVDGGGGRSGGGLARSLYWSGKFYFLCLIGPDFKNFLEFWVPRGEPKILDSDQTFLGYHFSIVYSGPHQFSWAGEPGLARA